MNILDTRDLQKRLEELESEFETLQDAVEEAEEALTNASMCSDNDSWEPLICIGHKK